MARALLECGAAPGAQDAEGVTPLHRATYSGHAEVVRALLAHGAAADPVLPWALRDCSWNDALEKVIVAGSWGSCSRRFVSLTPRHSPF